MTLHYVGSRRRAGSHWLAEAFRELGWDVTFVTTAFSQLSRIKRDHRFTYGLVQRAGRLEVLASNLSSYVWFTLFHPLNRLPRPLAWALTPLFRRYGDLPAPGLEQAVVSSNLVIFESTAGLMLVHRIRRWAPSARLVYRVADDLRTLRAHPVVLDAERKALPLFDLISVPSEAVRRAVGSLPTIQVHHHAVARELFDHPGPDPYEHGGITNAVFVGTAYLDSRSLEIAARELPDWRFHVIGPVATPTGPNIVPHGELDYAATVPFIVHADVGLGMLASPRGVDSYTDSLKIIQYTYARLPIVVPQEMQSERKHSFAYLPGDEDGIRSALLTARAFDRSAVDRSGIYDWRDLALVLAGERPARSG